MQSLLYVKGSDGTANASVATVQTLRNAGASIILVNTVAGIPAKFYGSMGTPHTFTDPITSEVITVISDATAVDFAGHVNAGTLVIDAIAPGYADTNGSKVGDIIIVRPITEWANNIFNVLNQSLNDDGSFKTGSIVSNAPFVTAVDPVQRAADMMFDHVVTKLGTEAVLAGLGYGSTLTASLGAGVCYINGNRQLIAAVATRTYTANKDTYVDALYNVSGTATIVYTEVANNAASPALAANSIRLGIVVSGANIASVASINQGQETKLLPIASSIPYAVTDSLGNLICPRDPNRKILGYRQIITDVTTASLTYVDLTGLNLTCNIPAGRKVNVSCFAGGAFTAANVGGAMNVVDVTNSNTQIIESNGVSNSNNGAYTFSASIPYTPSASGARTFKSQGHAVTSGTLHMNGSVGSPVWVKIELA